MKPIIPLIFLNYKGKEVAHVTQFESMAVFEGSKAVHRSSIYKLIKENPMYFTEGEDYIFYADKKDPQYFREFVKKYKHIPKVTSSTVHFLTRQGVEKICRHYDINPETLRSNKEVPEDAPKQSKLISSKKDELMKLFQTGESLIIGEEDNTVAEQPERDSRVYIRDFTKKEQNVILGFNDILSEKISTFNRVKNHIDNKEGIYAQVYIQEDELIIRLVEKDTKGAIRLKPTIKNGVMTNLALRKTSYTNAMLRILKNKNLVDVESRDVKIYAELQAITATNWR